MPPVSRTIDLACAPLLHGLTDAEIHEIAGRAVERRLPSGRNLYAQNEPAVALYLVVGGRLRLAETTPDGKEVILGFLSPGELCGSAAMLPEGTYGETATTTAETRLMAWPRAEFDALVVRRPRLVLNALRLETRRAAELQARLRELATSRVDTRLARLLQRLWVETGRPTAEGVELESALSREELAHMTGTTLFTVSRTLGAWQRQGVLTLGRRRIVIRDHHKLADLAEEPPPEPLGHDGGTPRLDVRRIPPRNRPRAITEAFLSLGPGEQIELMTDHEPLPLRRRFDEQFGDSLQWTYLEEGPHVWRVRLRRLR